MCSYRCIALMTFLIFPKLNALSVPNASTILEIIDSFGIDPLDILNILNSANAEELCKDAKNSQKDDLCTTQLKIVCEDEHFMSRMLDAFSKFPYSGMLIRTRIDYGSYDECIDLDLTKNGVRVIGKHCLGGLIVPTTELNDTNFIEKAFKLSICIPDGCSAKDLMTFLNISSDLQIINDLSCSTKESWKILGAVDYIVISFLLILVLIMVVSTLYDVYLYYTSQECPSILLQAFSVYYNGRKLLQVTKGPSDQIKVIHGLRVISMMWIVAAHASGTISSYPGINIEFPSDFEWSRKSFYITSAYLAVDTFFFLSGFLLAYQYLKQDSKPLKTHIKRIPYLYLHRYLRLTPALAAAFIITVTLLGHLGNGPIYYGATQQEKDVCLKYWWSFFLYIQNYVNYDKLCIISTWYLSADWQLFLISPLVLIPVAIFKKNNFRWLMVLLLLINIIFFTVAPIGLKLFFNSFNNQFETHTYLNGYFVGFTMGFLMREKCNSKYPFNTIWNFVLWVIVLLVMLMAALVYKEIQLARHFHDDLRYGSFLILVRPFWCMGLSWIIYSCHNGYGGLINWLLTTPFIQVLSKLTYCMYITHVLPVIYLRLITRVPIVYNELTVIKDTIISYCLTVFVATFWTLAFESPLIILEKYFIGSKR